MNKNLICNKQDTILRAMDCINQNFKGAVFVVDDYKKLCGIVTDGDIRRALMGGHLLGDLIGAILKKGFTFAKQGEALNVLKNKISDEIHIIPIVDNDFQIVDFFEFVNEMHIPIASPYLRGNELKYLVDAFLSSWISSSGEYLEMFETEFSNYCECEFGVAVSNGTVALYLALEALGVGEGDEVITTPFSFIASSIIDLDLTERLNFSVRAL